MFPTIAFLTGMPGWLEVVVVAVLGLLLFGRRLPGVARALVPFLLWLLNFGARLRVGWAMPTK